jgi:dinuclear metal center YbgI/SA1388 family protein
MKQATVRTFYDWLNSVAPFDTQEDFDNAGLQTGQPDGKVSQVLLTLDVTAEVIHEAETLGVELIIAHHPLIFTPLTSLNEQDYVASLAARLIRSRIALIAAHTNADQSEGFSGSFAVAELLGLNGIYRQGKYLFIGELPERVTAEALKERASLVLSAPVLRFGDPNQIISLLAIAGGSYSEGFLEALEAGAQALLTGEVRHHHAVEASAKGLVLFEGGHIATEQPMLPILAAGLQMAMDTLKYKARIHMSRFVPYRLG